MSHALNFTAGPSMLPREVLEQVQAELLDYHGRGMSILEMSHRSRDFEEINARAETNFKRLAGVGDDYRALFLQGGASTQFAMLPMNFLPPGGTADYILTGSWGEKAVEQARIVGKAHLAASTQDGGFKRTPRPDEIQISASPAYIHLTSNETIQGVQFHQFPVLGPAPLVADMSSDIFSRPLDGRKFAMIYAGAQKNLGPAGLAIVLVRRDWIEQANKGLPTIFRYATHAKNNSLYNTPPGFAVYVVDLVLQWIDKLGGLTVMADRNARKAAHLYNAIDQSGGFYQGHAEPASRSFMNVTFRLPDEAREKAFLAEAQQANMVGLAGHRSVGGIRASIYNAMSEEACQTLAQLMTDFAARQG